MEPQGTLQPGDPLLAVRDLEVRYRSAPGSPVTAVDGVSFDLAPGEALGLLGESGCGKTSLALAIPGLLPPGGRISGGSLRFRGRRLEELSERRLETVRGAEIGLVFQEPALALHPMRKVWAQVAEVLKAHRAWSKKRCRRRARELLAEVGLGGDEIGDAYPHQLSGGQRQRVVIAQALACRPALVIADEPTAALDATTEKEVLELLGRLKRRLGTAFLYISHDPQVLSSIADRLLVMYAGRLVEEGPRDRVLGAPLHPYTEALLGCRPPAGTAERGRPLPVIPGSAPSPQDLPPGCRFAPRCSERLERCTEDDPEEVRRGRRRVWCFLHPGEG